MVKNDRWIKKLSLEYKMIEPFEIRQIRDGKISYGTSSYGYDMRLSNEFMVMKAYLGRNQHKDFVLDPKKASDNLFETVIVEDYIEIPPNSVILGKTIEYFRIPRDIITIAFGKSTYARCGIFVNITPFEPEWEGYVTLSISNTTSLPAKVYANEGIAQILFLGVSETCEISYADKRGKYQKQKIITSAKI
ncbi:MAG: dCTP deaminase [Endomicrobium sp.]|nr:dCTP deaminase [Endomicrobium sp.]